MGGQGFAGIHGVEATPPDWLVDPGDVLLALLGHLAEVVVVHHSLPPQQSQALVSSSLLFAVLWSPDIILLHPWFPWL